MNNETLDTVQLLIRIIGVILLSLVFRGCLISQDQTAIKKYEICVSKSEKASECK